MPSSADWHFFNLPTHPHRLDLKRLLSAVRITERAPSLGLGSSVLVEFKLVASFEVKFLPNPRGNGNLTFRGNHRFHAGEVRK